jgi:nucleoid-associated protein YgaU
MPIMRKDVKLGLAVGGVLLAVLVVYVLVVPGSNSNQAGAILENLDGSEAQTSGASGEAVAQADVNAPAKAPETSTQDQQAKSGGASAETGSANAGAAGGPTGTAGAGTAGGATAKDSASAGGGWNWDALVNGTEKLPSMGVGTDVPTNTLVNSSGQLATGVSANGTSVNSPTANGTTPANQLSPTNDTSANGTATAQGGNGASHLPNAPETTAQQPRPGAADATSLRAEPAPTSPASAAQTHLVKAGDTYSKISLAVYGTSKHYAAIEQANPGVDPTRLKPGTTINLPAISTKQPTATPAVNGAAATIDPQKEYKVQPNDSLYTISLRLYGKADRMEKIYELNKATIGDDMARVKVGMILKLPEAPTQTTAAAQAR